MLSLSECHMYVQHNTYQGIFKLSLLREYHNFSIKTELFKINTSHNPDLLKVFVKNCEEDPNNPNICSLVSNVLEHTQTFNLKQSEELAQSFAPLADMEKDQTNYNKNFTATIGNLKLVMSFRNLVRIYHFFKSFTDNYFVLDAAYNIYIQQISQTQNTVQTSSLPTQEPIHNEVTTPPPVKHNKTESPAKNFNKSITEKKNVVGGELDIILSMSLTSTMKLSAIHYIFTYYRFLDPKYCYVRKNDNDVLEIHIPKILPYGYIFNEDKFETIIQSMFDKSEFTTEKVDYAIKKLLSMFFTTNEKIINNSICIMAISYLLFLYFLKYAADLFPNDFKTKFTTYIASTSRQYNMFKYFIRSIPVLSDIKNYIEFHVHDVHDDIFTDNTDTINKLSDQYKHLIPVSPQKFADMIFDELNTYDNKKPQNFNLSQFQVLDLNHIMQSTNNLPRTSILFGSVYGEGKPPDADDDYNNRRLLNYNPKNEYLTKEYKYFREYLDNPSSILMIKDPDFTESIKFLFDVVSQIVPELNQQTCDLLYIYNKIIDNLPHPENISHNAIMTVLYKVIVPHQYVNFKITKFNDYFLT